MKKRVYAIILCCLLLILEALPLGSALHIATTDDSHTVQFCSYFNLMPFGNGNFAPFIVAILSAVLLALCALYAFRPSKNIKKLIFAVSCVAMILGFCPLLYCMQCYSWVDCLITFILFILTMMFVEQAK